MYICMYYMYIYIYIYIYISHCYFSGGPISVDQDSSKVGAVETGCSDLYDVIH